jgi:hypothetical protein
MANGASRLPGSDEDFNPENSEYDVGDVKFCPQCLRLLGTAAGISLAQTAVKILTSNRLSEEAPE